MGVDRRLESLGDEPAVLRALAVYTIGPTTKSRPTSAYCQLRINLVIPELERTGSSVNKREKLVSGLFLAKSTQHGGRYCGGVLLFDSAHHHAQMPRFNDYPHALRSDSTLNRFSNLCRETLLHLQSTRKYVHQARNLAEPNHFPLRNISDVDLAKKRQKVVLAETKHLNILDDDHLVISHIEHRPKQSFVGILTVSLGQILHRTLHAFGGMQQAIPLWVLVETDQCFPHELL